MKKIPISFKKLFWDVDYKQVNIKRHAEDIIRRILNNGDEKSVKWMYNNYKIKELKDVLINYRGISRKSANYWSLMLNVPKEEIKCLKNRLSKDQKTIWPY